MAEKTTENKPAAWIVLALILAAQSLVLALAPNERTLGAGIKPVYLHVSLTWAGMILLAVSAALGLGLVVSKSEKLASWLRTILTAGWALYLIGFLVSMIASYINWGGVPFKEPRVLGSLNVLVISTVALVLVKWINQQRIAGLLGAAPTILMAFTVSSSRMALHPDSTVGSSPSGIKFTFYGMFLLALLLGGWGIHFLRKRQWTTKKTTIEE